MYCIVSFTKQVGGYTLPRGVNFSLIVLLKFEFVQFDYASQKWGRIFFLYGCFLGGCRKIELSQPILI